MNVHLTSFDNVPASEEAALWAYRLILGREPENSEALRDHAQCSTSLSDLRERFLRAPEFTQRFRAVEREHGRNVSVFPPCHIDVAVNDDTRDRIFDHIAKSWDHLGKTEPYWSVLSAPDFLMERIGQTRDEFLESGQENVERLLATLRRNDVFCDEQWEVLELGCGLGRSTRWLAPLFRRVMAVDISESHLMLARKINADAPEFNRIEWTQLRTLQDLGALPEFDLFFSMIVLQHNPPPVIAMMLETIAAKLRPGGIAFFQVPTYQRDYSFDVKNYLRLQMGTREIEMHAIPQSEVFRIFREHDCIPLEVFEDGLSGHRDNHRSNSFLFRKILRSNTNEQDAVTDFSIGRLPEVRTVIEEAKRELAQERRKTRDEITRIHAAALHDHQASQAALADATSHAAAQEARCNALQARLDEINRRLGWLRILLPKRRAALRERK